jgi:hypothetical protein
VYEHQHELQQILEIILGVVHENHDEQQQVVVQIDNILLHLIETYDEHQVLKQN